MGAKCPLATLAANVFFAAFGLLPLPDFAALAAAPSHPGSIRRPWLPCDRMAVGDQTQRSAVIFAGNSLSPGFMRKFPYWAFVR